MKKKITWNLSGMEVEIIAKHHLTHLTDYAERNNIVFLEKGFDLLTDFTAITFIIVEEKFVDIIKNHLNPTQIIDF